MEEQSLLINQYKFQWIFGIFGLNNNIIFITLLSSSKNLMKDKMYVLSICTIIPGLLTKLLMPIFNTNFQITYKNKINISCIILFVSIVVISYVNNLSIKALCMIFISIASAICESIYIPLASLISDKSITYWSAGSGFAGILGSIYYLIITQILCLSPQTALLFLFWVPISSNFLIHILNYPVNSSVFNQDYRQVDNDLYLFWFKKYIFPLSSVYFLEYTINLCILPNIYTNKQDINILYPRFMLLYQVGVLLSRSSRLVINYYFDNIYIFPLIQLINIILLYLEYKYRLVNSIIVIYFIIFIEGIVGGLCYILTFSKINRYEQDINKELCCINTSIGEVIGQSLASLLSIINK